MSDVPDQDDLTGMTFDEIAERRDEEAAINAGIASDPDTFELDDEWFERSRPAVEIDPELVAYSRRTRGKQRSPVKERVTIRLDTDLTAHFRAGGRGWQTRLNETLRRAGSAHELMHARDSPAR